jgi:hypothetical protein
MPVLSVGTGEPEVVFSVLQEIEKIKHIPEHNSAAN